MSKNIIIQEGGTPYQFTAKKLKTDKVGGGSILWVPEEETVLKKLRVTEEGTYKASDEGYYGYSEVVVDVTGHGSLKTKRITQNGTYKAEDDGLMGYSKVKVNVRGGNGSANSSGAPVVTFDSDGNVENAPGGIGSAVTGIDPTTGEWIAVGVDSGGNLVTTAIPSAIEIVTLPTKTSYVEGETIDYSGIAVNLKKKDGNTFTNATYPNGRIPMQELIFPVEKAHSDSGGSGGSGANYITVSTANEYLGRVQNRTFYKYNSSQAFAFFILNSTDGDWMGPVLVSNDRQAVYTDKSQFAASFEYDGDTYYYNAGYLMKTSGDYDTPLPINSDISIYDAAYAIIAGQSSGKVNIPVRWASTYDGRTFEDTFEITVTGSGSGSGSTDGGGYSDDSGGSSSGGGGGF